MQFTRPFKDAIRAGTVTCSFRTWKSPRAKIGGRYNLHPRGAIEVTDLRQIRMRGAESGSIRQSGFADRQALATVSYQTLC